MQKRASVDARFSLPLANLVAPHSRRAPASRLPPWGKVSAQPTEEGRSHFVAPCAAFATRPRLFFLRPFTAPQSKRRRAVRRADLMLYFAYKISHSETKNVFYFFPFQQ